MSSYLSGTPLPATGRVLLALILLLGCLGTAYGAEGGAVPIPGELQLILKPGKGGGDAILFSPLGDEPARRERAVIRNLRILKQPPADEVASEESPLPEVSDRAPQLLASTTEYTGYQPEFKLTTGYRRDRLHWSIAALDGSPNILSELRWDEVESLELAGELRWSNPSNLYLRACGAVGWIVDGDNRDSDYLGDDRTLEFSRSYADTDGSVMDGSIGVGYRFDLPLFSVGDRFHLMPLAGYSYHAQNLEDTDGRQVVAAYGFPMPLGPFGGLDSSYDAYWHGPWLGFDFDLGLSERHHLTGSLEYHWADYRAEADWNLREDFQHPVSFRHKADGEGVMASIGYRYRPQNRWFLELDVHYRNMSADAGEDKTWFSDGSSLETRLNEVEWESWSVDIGLGFLF
jgi:outer membrane protease